MQSMRRAIADGTICEFAEQFLARAEVGDIEQL
jgi:queuine/archaeosine tRNA-ribosyltransferase